MHSEKLERDEEKENEPKYIDPYLQETKIQDLTTWPTQNCSNQVFGPALSLFTCNLT